jgi:hypothetical protein
MDCLRDLIQVAWCGNGATVPTSGNFLYINSLPGISFKQIVSLTNEEQRSWRGVWDDVTLRASRRFANDFRQAMNKRYKIKSALQVVRLGADLDLTTTRSTAGELRGIVIELNNDSGNQYVPSALQQIAIDKLFYYHNTTAATVTFNLWDLDTGMKLHTFDYACVNGWNVISYQKRINNEFTAVNFTNPRRVFVCAVTGAVSSPALNINDIVNIEFYGGTANIKGGYATAASSVTSVTTGTNTYGLSATITVGCAWENFVCEHQQLFETAFWYLCGIELMNEVLNSDRLNYFTTIGSAKADKLKSQYEVMYMGGAINGINYEGALPQVVDGVNINLFDNCIECNEQITIREAVL